jgi:hypothetical protein
MHKSGKIHQCQAVGGTAMMENYIIASKGSVYHHNSCKFTEKQTHDFL